jgi:hypothetical protein
MSSKSNIAFSRWRAGLVALGLVLLVAGGYGLYAREDAKPPETAPSPAARRPTG